MEPNLGLQQLNDLLEVRNTLMKCRNVEEVIRDALTKVRQRLHSQVASIFLFSKDGFVERRGINGVDKDGLPIDNTWFQNEKYKPGESFSGKAVPFKLNSVYGEPQWSNSLDIYEMNAESKTAYLEKLGYLKYGISVPLNGSNRTFGTIEVINKVDSNNKVITNNGFCKEDVYWLIIIGMNVATVISSLRKKEKLEIFAQMTQELIKPLSDLEEKYVYDYIAKQLTSSLRPYKACILRIANDAEVLEVVAKNGTNDVSWQERVDEPRDKTLGIVGKVYRTGKTEIVENIEKRKDEYKNLSWIQNNGFKSHACFPLKLEGKTIGTLSIFTSYPYRFYNDNLAFIDKISSLVAAFTERVHMTYELRRLRNECDRERDTILSAARLAGYNNAMQGVLHQYKNEILDFCHILQEIESAGVVRRAEQIINKQITFYKERVVEIQKEFEADELTSININDVIRDVIEYFSLEIREKNTKIVEKYQYGIPNVLLVKAEIKDVIYNLISNAIRAIQKIGRKNGEITISTDIDKSERITYVQISVEDNGIGIRKELSEQIFEKGFTSHRDEGGTGRGLFITRRILSNYGGKILFESTVGKGTKFFVKIPLKRHQA
ncbi:ATP-binding protein [Nostoc sp. ChiVER01]|uniref:ATP-binding protein n=1 Tax=Nostoc sp. ChiVER01 TaxID=3075382 RepID=UPI002AD45E71|nr:ATP-binding protein [Nostoc sp. ChiVER01]MDZ8222549.1 ATP-binding protein [Nostoc sp. ChiVER01]